MSMGIGQVLSSLWDTKSQDRLKVLCLGTAFFSIIGSYTIIKELKDSIFINIVGSVKSVAYAKLFMTFGFIPLVFFYSILVDRIRRYQLLSYFAWGYSLIGLLSAVVINTNGLGAEVVEPYSFYWWFGWVFYVYIESFSPFMIGVFWAFLSSITSPEEAKSQYGLLITFSKFGGIVASGLAWFLLAQNNTGYGLGLSDTNLHTFLIVLSSAGLLIVPAMIGYMMRTVSGKYLHGYEAAYQFEKKQSKQGHKNDTGILGGLMMLLKYPYVFGIFCTFFFYEFLSSILSYMRLGIAQSSSCNVSGVSCFLFKIVFCTHFIGFLISLLGTRVIMSYLGERLSLLVMPVVMGTLMVYLLVSTSPTAVVAAFVAFRAIYYSFHQPVTEALYIPTVKDMKFKSKSWIDTFGKKFARSVGSSFNIMASSVTGAVTGGIHGIVFGGIISLWVAVAYLLGSRYHQAVSNNEVIGASQE